MNGVMFTLTAAALLGAAPSGPWESDYAVALKQARAEGKPMLVVLHKPQVTGQRLRQVSLTADGEGRSLERFYQLCEVNVTTDYGKKVAEAFKVTSFPHTVITDKQGKQIIFEKTGHVTDTTWITALSDHRHGNRPFTAVSFGAKSITSYRPQLPRTTLPSAATCFT